MMKRALGKLARDKNLILPMALLVLIFSIAWTTTQAAEKAEATVAATKVKDLFAGTAPMSVADLKAMQQHVRKITEKVVPSTVGVQIGQAHGSGVIISKDGYVLTAAHVAGKPGKNVTLTLPSGRKVQGKTLGMNFGIDAGLMKITTEGEWPFLEMGKSSELKQGQWCMAVGHPGGYQAGRKPVVRLGRIQENAGAVVVTDCALVGGDSGGPLLNMDGKVIGIHSRIGAPLVVNMHVPVNTYRDTWDRLAASESWGKFGTKPQGPFLGVQGVPDASDAKIGKVYPDTPAAKAGIKAGDIITKFNDKPVKNFADLKGFVQRKKSGDKVKLELRRGEETVKVEVVLGDPSE